MATQLVPYNTAMQLGSGFNSFTQTLCINNAFLRVTDSSAQVQAAAATDDGVAQSVTYKTCVINKATDVTDEMNINAAFNITYDNLSVGASGSYINTSKIKESDVSIMVSVKVVNQAIYDHSLTKFQPIPVFKDLSSQRLIDIYGDSFISGWQEGGEFLAVISIKAKNRDEAQNIAVDAKIAFTRAKEGSPVKESGAEAEAVGQQEKGKETGKDKKALDAGIEGEFDKLRRSITGENEVSVSVTWTGGGQRLKAPEMDWNFETMRDVALSFPDRCAKTPIRTHAHLTKYTATRSFYTVQPFDLPVYDKTGTYTSILQEAYLDYKSILGSLQVLAFDVAEGTMRLIPGVRGLEQIKARECKGHHDKPTIESRAAPSIESTDKTAGDAPAASESLTDSAEGQVAAESPTPAQTKSIAKVVNPSPLIITEPFAATIEGIKEARRVCRFMMNRIVQEIDNIRIKPEIAGDESRPLPYQSPFLFKLLLPIGSVAPPRSTQAEQAVAAAQVDPEELANKFLAVKK